MCGIAGILSFGHKIETPSIENMISVLRHRGPDGDGTWINSAGQVALGHKRLSIIDLTDTGKQPMHFADGRYTITYNGEIYNYRELRNTLQQEGYTFHSESDTEVLLALYDLKKEKALADLDGMFSFAIWDEKEKLLFCARDRFGEKPFYYHMDQRQFSFASEMKSLFKNEIPKIKNQKKVYNYLLYNVLEDPDDRASTFYETIFQLEPSHFMIVRPDKSLTKKRYWDLSLDEQSDLSEKQIIEKFQELFNLSVSRRLRSDVPVGSSLSGGLDSSSIVMMIDKIKDKNTLQKTFSARFKNFDRDEGEFMQQVISKTNAEPHFVFPTAEALADNLQNLFYHQEEPIGSSSVAAQFEVMKLAKENNVKVLLDGQGADEMMAGYNNFWSTYFSQLYRTQRSEYQNEKNAYLILHASLPFKNDGKFKWQSIHNGSFKFISDKIRELRPSNSAFFNGIHPDIVSAYKSGPNPIPKANTLKEHLYYYLMQRGLNELLRYADKNAMANSVEVRLPFLYHQLVEFTFSLPDKMLLQNGWTKFILRKSMEDILPPAITWRKDKIGFEPPQKEWMKGEFFNTYLKEAIASLKRDKIITQDYPHLHWNYISLYTFNSLR